MATVMMACMLLTVVNVSSDAVDSVVPYGQELDGGRGELN